MDNDWSEHYIKKGDPAAPTYYIMRRPGAGAGLLSNYHLFAGHIKYALANKYLPVVDMKNYAHSCLAPELIGKENAWEYYFTQPLGITLEQAYAGENVILSATEKDIPPGPEGTMSFYKDKGGILTEWKMLVKLGLLKIQPHLQKEIDDTYDKFFSSSDRVLGVALRGTDYIALKPHAHPIPPPLGVCIVTYSCKSAEMELQ